MAETVDMVVDAEVVAAMVVDRAAMTRVAMAGDREVMGVVATKTSPPKLCTVQMLNIKYSPCVLSLLSNNFHIKTTRICCYIVICYQLWLTCN